MFLNPAHSPEEQLSDGGWFAVLQVLDLMISSAPTTS